MMDKCDGCQIRWERDKAMEQLEEHHIPFMCVAEDVVEVVRCKDCCFKHENLDYADKRWCQIHRFFVEDDYYCADGARETE